MCAGEECKLVDHIILAIKRGLLIPMSFKRVPAL